MSHAAFQAVFITFQELYEPSLKTFAAAFKIGKMREQLNEQGGRTNAEELCQRNSRGQAISSQFMKQFRVCRGTNIALVCSFLNKTWFSLRKGTVALMSGRQELNPCPYEFQNLFVLLNPKHYSALHPHTPSTRSCQKNNVVRTMDLSSETRFNQFHLSASNFSLLIW